MRLEVIGRFLVVAVSVERHSHGSRFNHDSESVSMPSMMGKKFNNRASDDKDKRMVYYDSSTSL